MVLADVLKRWQLLLGRKALLSTGTDEHGMKIQQAAEMADIQPGRFCDMIADRFKVSEPLPFLHHNPSLTLNRT